MTDRPAPRLTKWPFFLADIALLGVAGWIFSHYPHPLDPWAGGAIAACIALAAWLGVWPFRLEYDTEVRLFESNRVVDATEAIRNLDDVSGRIQQATSQWQGVQEHASRTTQAAREIADRISTEARAFSEFMSKANDSERATLRLETEKLRRNEGQWLQVLVHTLDHVHALYQAGARSGQPNLANQLATFQAACRDLARRVGLTAIDAEIDQPYDETQHEPVPGEQPPAGPAQIAQVIAAGYSYQGQILRKPIVALKAAPPETSESLNPASAAAGVPLTEEPAPEPADADASTTANLLADATGSESTLPADLANDVLAEAAEAELAPETAQPFVAASAEPIETIETIETVETLETVEASRLAESAPASLDPANPDPAFEINTPEATDGSNDIATELAAATGTAPATESESGAAPSAGSAIEEFRLESDPIEDYSRRRRASGA